MSEAAVAEAVRRVVLPPVGRLPVKRRALAAETVEGTAAYAALAADWRRLAELQPTPTLFQTPEILSAWARAFAPRCRLTIIVVRSEGRPVLIWPLAVERRMLLRVARGAGSPLGQYDEILLDPAEDRERTFAAALAALKDIVRPDLVLLQRVRADSTLRGVLSDIEPICSEAAPFSDLSRGLEGALAATKPAVAKKQRKRMRRFHKEGRVSFALAANPDEAAAWLGQALALKRDWLRSTGRVSRAFVRPETADCLAGLARTLWKASAPPRMVVSRLTLDDRAAAFEVGFCHGTDYYLYLRSFAPDLAALGPGNVLTEYMLGWCAAGGIRRYDMLAPRTRNKSEWQSGEVPVMDVALPLSPGGRLYVAAVLRRLAPAFRAAFYRLPDALRSRLAGLALRM